ncbi:Carboxylesterase 5A [Colletotrichum sidae]|uniref:Carboxylic ester hydrolase n=1 Tax=Colletotrichum sidae TaxID=1347389 RepID=A0A4R8TM47_9PEZI|nr:Carboxylesterase 5A [Colletotrichum sidae]
MKLSSLCISFILGVVSLVEAAASPSAVIDAGTIVGTTTTLPSSTVTVNKFLGIPYAQPPIEEKRFLPPQSVYTFEENPVNATAWGNKCWEISGSDVGVSASEDCLFLNVYAPARVGCSTSGRPVLVWIHGGWLRSGTASQRMFDGSSFASEQGIVVVTFNYRLNIFGFPNSPQLPLRQQNLGFLDQRLALQWVQTNIHAFGGDPAKVTIAGESSGGSSVDRLVTTIHDNPPERLHARAAKRPSAQSGETQDPYRGNRSWVFWVVLAKTRLPAPVSDNFTQQELPYLPARAAGGVAPVPLLIGTTGLEGSYLAPAYGLNISEFTAPVLEQFLYGFTGGDAEVVGGIIQVVQLVQQTTAVSLFHAAAQVETEIVYQCPALLVSSASAQMGIPTWRYFYNASFPNLAPPGYSSEELGASHGSDTAMIWGTYPLAGATEQQARLSKALQVLWSSFVKDPSGTGPGWERVDANGDNIACVGCGGDDSTSLLNSAAVDGRCAIYEPYFGRVRTPFVKS